MSIQSGYNNRKDLADLDVMQHIRNLYDKLGVPYTSNDILNSTDPSVKDELEEFKSLYHLDWFGSIDEYNTGISNGTITEDMMCYIMDEDESFYDGSNTRIDADTLGGYTAYQLLQKMDEMKQELSKFTEIYNGSLPTYDLPFVDSSSIRENRSKYKIVGNMLFIQADFTMSAAVTSSSSLYFTVDKSITLDYSNILQWNTTSTLKVSCDKSVSKTIKVTPVTGDLTANAVVKFSTVIFLS